MQIIHQAPLAVLGMGAAFTILWGVADPMAAFAEVREVEAEGYYMMGDSPEERMDIAQQHAIRDATKAAAEKAGVFVESFSEMRMGNLTRDEVRAISAIVLEVKEPTKVVPEVVANGQYEQAVEAFTKALELSNLADGWEGLGDAYLGLKQYEQAAEAYRKALDLDPSSSHSWNQLGVCYSYLDDNEKEIECFKKAVELNPNDQTIKENLDRALSRG